MAPDGNEHGVSPKQSICEKNEEVIDDEGSDADDAFTSLQRIMSAKRREKIMSKSRIQMNLDPIPFQPVVRPLRTSDLASAIALENAAFSDPQHRASADKVSGPSGREGHSRALLSFFGFIAFLTCHIDRVPTDYLPRAEPGNLPNHRAR